MPGTPRGLGGTGARAEGSSGIQAGPPRKPHVFCVVGGRAPHSDLAGYGVTWPHRPPAASQAPMRQRLEALLGNEGLWTQEEEETQMGGETRDSGGVEGRWRGQQERSEARAESPRGVAGLQVVNVPVRQGPAHLWGLCLPFFPLKSLPVPGAGADTRCSLRVLGHRGGLGSRPLAEKEGGKEERPPRASLTVPECDHVEYDVPSDSPN